MVAYKINDPNTPTNGSSLKGYITTTYNDLVKLFGEPKSGSADGKTTCEWIVEFGDGTIATIHDWKTKPTPKHMYNWSIGGHSNKAIDALKKITNAKIGAYKF